jgi:hypothetical protein
VASRLRLRWRSTIFLRAWRLPALYLLPQSLRRRHSAALITSPRLPFLHRNRRMTRHRKVTNWLPLLLRRFCPAGGARRNRIWFIRGRRLRSRFALLSSNHSFPDGGHELLHPFHYSPKMCLLVVDSRFLAIVGFTLLGDCPTHMRTRTRGIICSSSLPMLLAPCLTPLLPSLCAHLTPMMLWIAVHAFFRRGDHGDAGVD